MRIIGGLGVIDKYQMKDEMKNVHNGDRETPDSGYGLN